MGSLNKLKAKMKIQEYNESIYWLDRWCKTFIFPRCI